MLATAFVRTRGRGLGRTLTSHLCRCALVRGELPFLHVLPGNPAVALYGRLGFRGRARPCVILRRPRT
ncbi:MAG: hypothetical protein FJX35_01900 [Alphaproteobacteria bacterium]|nr:hypothetical protein [Alphaproteobacteria bacterium]